MAKRKNTKTVKKTKIDDTRLTNRKNIISVGLSTMTLWLGLQIFHVYLPSVIDFLTTYLVAEQQALYALATFALVLFVPVVFRLLGERMLLLIIVGGLIIVRLSLQFSTSQMADLVLSTIGVVLWIWFLPYWHQSRRNRPNSEVVPTIVLAFPLAIFLDTVTRSLIWFDEIAFQSSFWALLVVLALSGVTFYLLYQELEHSKDKIKRIAEEPSFPRLLSFLGVGAALYLLLIILTSPIKLAALMPGTDIRLIYLFVNVVTAIGVLEVVSAINRFNARPWLMTLLIGGVIVISLQMLNVGTGPGWLWFGLAALETWALFGRILEQTSRKEPLKPGLWRSSVVTFVALLLMLICFFLVEEFNISITIPIAGGLLLLAAIWATVTDEREPIEFPAGIIRFTAIILVVGLLASGVWALISRPPQVDGTPFAAVFANGEDGYACYRIPSIVRAGDGSLVAFAEGRLANCADDGGVINIVSRRSTDNGATWGNMKVVGQYIRPDGSDNYAFNPAPVVDLMDPDNPQGKMVLIYNAGDLDDSGLTPRRVHPWFVYATESLDHGLTWSDPVDITDQLINDADWRVGSPPIGHAIQLERGDAVGRLLFTGHNSIDGAGRLLPFWSDDHGATWQLGAYHDYPGINETMSAELVDGSVLSNSRHYDENGVRVGFRAITQSSYESDGSITYGETTTDTNLQSPTVQASIQRYSWPDDTGVGSQDRLLFSIPDHARLRTNMTVRLSYDEGETWPVAQVIDPGPSAYSDLVVQNNGDIGLLYERGNDGGIYYGSFSLDWLTDGEDVLP